VAAQFIVETVGKDEVDRRLELGFLIFHEGCDHGLYGWKSCCSMVESHHLGHAPRTGLQRRVAVDRDCLHELGVLVGFLAIAAWHLVGQTIGNGLAALGRRHQPVKDMALEKDARPPQIVKTAAACFDVEEGVDLVFANTEPMPKLGQIDIVEALRSAAE